MTTGIRRGSYVVSVMGHSKGFDASAKITARGHGGAYHCTTKHLLESTGANFSMQTSLCNLGGTHNVSTNVKVHIAFIVKTLRIGNMDESEFVHAKPVINKLPSSLTVEQKRKGY